MLQSPQETALVSVAARLALRLRPPPPALRERPSRRPCAALFVCFTRGLRGDKSFSSVSSAEECASSARCSGARKERGCCGAGLGSVNWRWPVRISTARNARYRRPHRFVERPPFHRRRCELPRFINVECICFVLLLLRRPFCACRLQFSCGAHSRDSSARHGGQSAAAGAIGALARSHSSGAVRVGRG